MSFRLIVLGLLLCASACSTTPTPQVGPPRLQALLQPESVESQWASRDALMADPVSTPVDTDNQLIQTEAALRRANRDQLSAWQILQGEIDDANRCGWWSKLRRKC